MFPAKKEKPEWETLLYAFDWQPGLTVTFKDLSTVLQRDFLSSRGVIYKLEKELVREKGLVLRAIRNVGYQTIHPEDNKDVAIHHGKKARKQVKMSKHIITHTRPEDLSPEGREIMEIMYTNFSKLEHQMKFFTRRTERVEKKVSDQQMELAELRKQVFEIQQQLKK